MGVYQYTLRADTKQVGHLEIGHFAYSYKHSFWGDKHYDRMVATKSYHAEAARDKLGRVKHFVQGEWSYAEGEEGLPIHYLEDAPSEFTEELRHTRIVGVLRKVDGRYRVTPPYGWMLARNEALDAELVR